MCVSAHNVPSIRVCERYFYRSVGGYISTVRNLSIKTSLQLAGPSVSHRLDLKLITSHLPVNEVSFRRVLRRACVVCLLLWP